MRRKKTGTPSTTTLPVSMRSWSPSATRGADNILASCRCPASTRSPSPTAGRGSWPSAGGAPAWPSRSVGSRSGIPPGGALAPAGAGDPRPPPRDVRAPGERAARPPDRRAGADDPLPEHQRPQPRRRLRPHARALPHLGGGPRRPARRAGGGAAARRAGAVEDAPDPARAGEHRRPARPRLARRGAAAAGPRLPHRPARASGARRRPASSSSASTAPRSRSTPT